MPTKYYKKARICVELCRFSYKMYAQTAKFPIDPFFEADPKCANSNNVRERMMAGIHEEIGTLKSDDRCKFDPVEYRLGDTPDPSKSIIYRGGTNYEYLVFVAGTWDKKIGKCAGFDLEGTQLPEISGLSGRYKCGYFQGQTGMTVNHPKSHWTSFLGAVIYDSSENTAYIVFRGSRSGDGTRAATGAQFKSEGSPDWVTDMNHLKEHKTMSFGSKVTLAAGFWFALESARTSITAAFNYAVGSNQVDNVCITGHSLGGALAQCLYIDLGCNKGSLKLKNKEATIECYPISAPPVCLGSNTQRWISRHANASNVHHYYCPYDAVHACSLVLGGTEKKLAWVLKAGSHPLTSPHHFGSQVALDSDEKFPDAHEPFVIWEALWKGETRPKKFWQQISFISSGISSSFTKDAISQSDIDKAVLDTFNKADFINRARQWARNISKTRNQETANTLIDEVSNANTSNEIKLLRKEIAKIKGQKKSNTLGCICDTLSVCLLLQNQL